MGHLGKLWTENFGTPLVPK